MSDLPHPAYLTTAGLAYCLSCRTGTVRKWMTRGYLRGIRVQAPTHWTDPKRKTARGQWRIELASVEELLTRLYTGQRVPHTVRRRLHALAAKLP